jgi:hypothetical protein
MKAFQVTLSLYIFENCILYFIIYIIDFTLYIKLETYEIGKQKKKSKILKQMHSNLRKRERKVLLGHFMSNF